MCLAACGDKQCLIKTTTTKHDIEIQTIKNKCNDGRIVSEQEISRTPDGKLIANGYFREYFDNGALHSIAFFKNNKQDSIAIKYYQNGNKELEFYWQNGIQIGFQSIYNQNGKYQRRDYFLKDSTKLFIVTYNEKGDIEKLDGTLFYIAYNKDVDNVQLGEEIKIINEVITLENTETLLTLKFTDPNKKTLVDTTVKQFLVFKNQHFVPVIYSPKEKGEYEYSLKVQLIDKSDGKMLKEDSINFTIRVK